MSTVFAKFERTAAQHGARPFLHIPPHETKVATAGYSDGPVDFTYAEALERVRLLREAYGGAGYGPGQRVALLLGNRAEFFLHWLALNALGVAIVPVGGEAPAGEVAHALSLSEPALAVTLPEGAALLADAAARAGLALPIVAPGEEVPTVARASSMVLGAAPGADSECAMLFTSGSTGRPKGCLLSNAYFTIFGAWYRDLGGLCALRPGADRLITPLPLTHMNALACSTMGMIETGGCIVQLDRFHPSTWWRAVAETGATVVHYLGVMPAMLLGLPREPVETAHAVRFGFGAGADPRHHAAFEARFGFPLVEGWAMTETGAGGCIMANHEPRHVGTRCFGREDEAVEVRIVDAEERDVAPGEAGELLVRAAGEDPRRGFFSGYYRDAEATEAAWAGGWLHSGDMVRRGEDGALHFVDRKKAIIRRSGENISAVEVESVLAALPGVAAVAVAPVPDDVRDEEVMACVVLGQGAEPSEGTAIRLFDATGDELAYFKRPGYIAFVETLPLTASQKIQRGEIRAICRRLLEDGAAYDLRELKRRDRKQSGAAE